MNGITAAILFLAISRLLEKTDVQGRSTTYCVVALVLVLLWIFTLVYALASLFF